MIKAVEKQQLKVPAHIDYLGDLRDFVTQIGKKHGFSDKIINAFKLSVDEAATNIIRHAYREKEGLITIRAVVKKSSLTISLIDQGKYFDPKRVKDPDLNRYVDIGKKGGLGIFIMRKLMDEIEYRKIEEGNELRITKKREPQEKKKLIGAVSTIPFSIKANYFLRTAGIVAGIVFLAYLYFFLVADNRVKDDFVTRWRATNSQVNSRIRALSVEEFETLWLDAGPDIFEDYQDQILKLSIEDTSGLVEFSSSDLQIETAVEAEKGIPFFRPDDPEEVEPNLYKYELDGHTVYEFMTPIVLKNTERQFGKTHVYWLAEEMNQEISAARWNYFRLALVILGLSSAGIAVLIYLLLNPFRKLSEWVKNLGTGDIEDEIDIDSSTEIGEIAQAFSGMTKQLRESQKNLADQERIKKEMQVAKEIQQTLLPMEFPDLEGYEIAAYYEAAKEVGGDYYDFVEVDKDTLGIAVADVSGKGVPGSLVMTMIRTALRTEARGVKDAAKVLSRVNAFVSSDIKKGMFVTVFYLIIDSKNRSLNYASAGHNPMVLYRPRTNQTYYLNPKGFPIGVQLPQKDYFENYIESDTIKLTKDDILLLYTDGITEAMNSRRELFGEERLQRALREYGTQNANQFSESLKNDIYSFTEGSPQYDDITLVAIKEKVTREEDELRRAKEAHLLIAEGMAIQKACEEVNLTTYAYYNKFKKVFEEGGVDAFEVVDETAVEVKHLSIEEKTKIYDIIVNHPEYGASRIKDELNTEKYGFTDLSESKIYDFLVREHLNTKQLREAYIGRSRKSKRRMKPPGTPMMTLDGGIILKKPDGQSFHPDQEEDMEAESVQHEKSTEWVRSRPSMDEREETPSEESPLVDLEAGALIDQPIEDLLSKSHQDEDVDDDDFLELFESDSAEASQDDVETSEDEPRVSESEATHASLDELMSGSDIPDTDEDFEEEQTEFQEEEQTEIQPEPAADQPADQEITSEAESESSHIAEELQDEDDDISFEELYAETDLADETEAGSSEDKHLTAEEEPEVVDETALHENAESDVSEASEDLTFSSVDELLAATPEMEEDLEPDSEKNSEEIHEETDSIEEQTPPETEFAEETDEEIGEEVVSFSDLIQAIDDEIVYVTDPSSKKKSGDLKTKKSQQDENGKVDNEEQESREKILIAGIKHYKSNEYDKAIKEFKKVIALYPDFKEAHSILGNAYFRSKQYSEAAQAYERVKQIDPEDITAYENMGVIYANRGNYKEALSEWKLALELSPNRVDIKDKIRKTSRMISTTS